MCTVTYLPSANGYYLTSNRDEKKLRKPALFPKLYRHNNATLLFPKDGDAGGTWIAINQNGNSAVLLNGGIEQHLPTPPYARSRGLVFLDVIAAETPFDSFLQMELENIEPFTLVIADSNKLFECRWNGSKKIHKEIRKDRKHIWSSVTLYDERTTRIREQWFKEWQIMHTRPSAQEISYFHLFGGEGDPENAIRMNRSDKMLTVSITCIEVNRHAAKLMYHDLQQNKVVTETLSFMKQEIDSDKK